MGPKVDFSILNVRHVNIQLSFFFFFYLNLTKSHFGPDVTAVTSVYV